jgi:hypothetical protein
MLESKKIIKIKTKKNNILANFKIKYNNLKLTIILYVQNMKKLE